MVLVCLGDVDVAHSHWLTGLSLENFIGVNHLLRLVVSFIAV